MSPEDHLFQDSPLGPSSTREDLTQGYGEMLCLPEPGRGSRLHSSLYSRTPEVNTKSYGDFVTMGKSLLQKTLTDADAAASSAIIQLISFKETLEEDSAGLRQTASDRQRRSRQRGLLLEKLEDFKRINKLLRQQLMELQEAETGRFETDKHNDVLLKKLLQAESETQHLKRHLTDKEKRVEELIDLRRKEMENTDSLVQLTKSVEATRAHLQRQLRSKESDNNRLTVQLRGLERTLTEQKLEIDGLKGEFSALLEKALQEKDGLKKATRVQKHRAEKFEAAIDKCYSQLREKDVQLAEARSEMDSWRRQQEQKAIEGVQLDALIGLLKSQIADMTAKLERERDEFSTANEVLLQNVQTLNTKNGGLDLDNATLKASIAELEQKLALSEAAFKEESTLSQESRDQADQYQSQVVELQAKVDDLRIKYESLLREAEDIRGGKDAEVKKARQEVEGRVKELEAYLELLSATEQSLAECQGSLRRSEKRCAYKSESLRQLQVKVDSQMKKLKSCVEMKDLNVQLQEKVDALQRRMEDLHQEKQVLVSRLAGQKEALDYSGRQLEHQSAECQALNRQLETTLVDVKQQVLSVNEKAVYREESLQTRMLDLEAEKNRSENELKQLKLTKQCADKQFEVRLKDLQLSLDQSESHKQSILNYVDFLKNSYATMFDEGLPSTLGSSNFF